MEELEKAGILEGITVYARMELVGCFSCDGPKDKIDQLKIYLEEKQMGRLAKNFEVNLIKPV